jgi:hypothetical protein
MEALAGRENAAGSLGAIWSKKSVGKAIYSLAALLLFASLFLTWYGQPHSGPNGFLIDLSYNVGGTAWQSLGSFAFVLAGIGAAALTLAVVRAASVGARGTMLGAATVSLLGLGATLLILYRILSPPGTDPFIARSIGAIPIERSLESGVFVGLAGALGIALGGCLSALEARRRLPRTTG